ncbi:MAG TPA: NAD(P)/FAD-dependent oxidoreductase [Gallionellaceae bacterium]|nr:NAD(P)/FAD-dependent oxidoreductase [Gallionellaceae bacterium]
MTDSDVIIIGAGAAGMMCALTAAQRGRRVVLVDRAAKLAEKIRISGGGRCNFTNLDARPENYLSDNPHFCRSALARYTPRHFIALLEKHRLGYHEKTLGQLFCNEGSEAIIAMLKGECDAAGVQWCAPCQVEAVGHSDAYYVTTSRGKFRAPALVIATGGLSIPKIGATPFGYHVAEQFGIPIVKPRPGLVPLSFAPEAWKAYAGMSGVSLEAVVRFGKRSFRENILVTHRGLSGPAILQISSYWRHGEALHIDLLPDHDMAAALEEQGGSHKLLSNLLAQWLPKSFCEAWCAEMQAHAGIANKPLYQYHARERKQIAGRLHDWQVTPSGTLGYAKAEVTCGGVDTRALSSKTMECNAVPGLYFIGEVVDVTGQLGGYNFQWAWASGHAAGEAV